MKLIKTLLLGTFAMTAVTAFAAPAPTATEDQVIVSTQELPEATDTSSEQPAASSDSAETASEAPQAE